MIEPEAARERVIDFLRGQGLDIEEGPSGGRCVVASSGDTRFVGRPILVLPADLLKTYLDDVAKDVSYSPRPEDEALSLAQIHLLEIFDTDHGRGLNAVREAGLRRRPGGVELYTELHPLPADDLPDGEFGWVADRPT